VGDVGVGVEADEQVADVAGEIDGAGHVHEGRVGDGEALEDRAEGGGGDRGGDELDDTRAWIVRRGGEAGEEGVDVAGDDDEVVDAGEVF
jgi:hypothetical protein